MTTLAAPPGWAPWGDPIFTTTCDCGGDYLPEYPDQDECMNCLPAAYKEWICPSCEAVYDMDPLCDNDDECPACVEDDPEYRALAHVDGLRKQEREEPHVD